MAGIIVAQVRALVKLQIVYFSDTNIIEIKHMEKTANTKAYIQFT